MARQKKRCNWALGQDDAYVAYHDEEWGVPTWDDPTLFEFLILEGAQAGLSWATILKKRDGYRRCFADFEVEKVARFTDKRIEKVLQDPGIVRNRLKVTSTVTNAKAFVAIQKEYGTFAEYIWGFVNHAPKQNRWASMADVPAKTEESDTISKDLKKRGFKFVGSTIMYAYMQAVGMVNDHTVGCFRRGPCKKLASRPPQ